MLHIKKIKPMFTSIVTTADRFEDDVMDNGLIVAKKGDLKLWQSVIAVGSSVRDVNENDKVMLSFENYKVKKYGKNTVKDDMDANPTVGYNLPWVALDDEEGVTKECLLLDNRDIQYVFEGDEIEEPKNNLILPKKKTIII